MSGSSGQAMVETALVMPLFVFMIMGLVQMTLLYQARAMLKYAAYRAARAGALNNACPKPMKEAAVAALLPVLAPISSYSKASTVTDWGLNYKIVDSMGANYIEGGLTMVDVRICGPLKTYLANSQTRHTPARGSDDPEIDFDEAFNVSDATISDGPTNAAKRWRGFERTKLRVQVMLNQRMIIPFVNAIISQTWLGMRTAESLRVGTGSGQKVSTDAGQRVIIKGNDLDNRNKIQALTYLGRYFLPLYANYTFRMQSNFFLNACPLPEKNECFHYADSSSTEGAP